MPVKCAWCKRWRWNDKWHDDPKPGTPDDEKVTHTICPDCKERMLDQAQPHFTLKEEE